MDSQNAIKESLIKSGADIVGFADISCLNNPIAEEFPYAVSIAVSLDRNVVGEILRGPTQAYYKEYIKANEKLDELAQRCSRLIEYAGYKSHLVPATQSKLDSYQLSSELPHKSAATLSGIGWIGKSNLLVTKEYGSAIRLTTVPTTMPLSSSEPITESQCGPCNICAAVCPGKAIKGKLWQQGMVREELYDAFACRDKADELSLAAGIDNTICGICIANCPWTLRYVYGNSGS